jgi:hypothetical protein
MNIIKLIENQKEFYNIDAFKLREEAKGLYVVPGSFKEALIELQISVIELKISILDSLLSTTKQDIFFCVMFIIFLIMGIFAGTYYGFKY